MPEGEDLLDLERTAEQLSCEVIVLKDIIGRAQWHLGNDVQSSPPTIEETQLFLEEVRSCKD